MIGHALYAAFILFFMSAAAFLIGWLGSDPKHQSEANIAGVYLLGGGIGQLLVALIMSMCS